MGEKVPAWILCLRHGEKPIDAKGEEGDGLSAAGAERARLLGVALGRDAPGRDDSLLPDGAPPPSQIYVPDFKDGAKRRRSFLTMKPLADSLGLVPVRLDRDDIGGLAESVRNCGKEVVVICWEHDALVAWLQRFAGTVSDLTGDALPVEWDKGRFDVIWQLRRTASDGSAYEVTERAQALPVEEVYGPDQRTLGWIDRAQGRFVPQPEPEPEPEPVPG